MARPSIFSKEYERHKKRRKRFTAFIIILILAAAGIFLASGNIKGLIVSMASKNKNINLFSVFKREKGNDTAPSIVEQKQAPETETTTQSPAPVKEEEEKGYDIPLSDGTMIKAVYTTTDAGNKFKYVLPAEAPVSFNINPSGNAMVIMDTSAQNMMLVDISGNVQNITNTKYIFTDAEGKETAFKEEDVLERYKKYNYVWCSSPKFIDDENIAYLSQLPYISSKVKTKFFWAVNIKNKDKHVLQYSLKGENLKLGNTSEKGIELILDNGTVRFIKFDGGEIKVNE